MKKNIYILWIGGIGISAVARYYNELWYTVYWSDASKSELVKTLESEWITLCSFDEALKHWEIKKFIYTEAIPADNEEIQKAWGLSIQRLNYPQALAEIANDKKLIAIAWTHGKSTTTSLTSLVLKNSKENFTSVVGTILKEFENKNFFHRWSHNIPPLAKGASGNWEDNFFVIEACEYKRSFLNYTPTVGIITNIELDHLDYFKDLEDYLSAFRDFIWNIKSWGFAILNGDDENCQKLKWLRDDIQYIEVFDKYFSIDDTVFHYPEISLQVAGNHVLYDAKIAYIVWHMLGILDSTIVEALENYTGVWRRMEHIKNTDNNNVLMSDYGHHPTEIRLTLEALKEKHPEKKLYTIFQPHQYNRTLELIEEFKNCFAWADTVIIPNIYESRDSEEDKLKMPVEKFISSVNHPDITYWDWLENTLKLIKSYDSENPDSSIILLLWAWNVDTLRYEL